MIYAGSAALKGDYTRTGQRSLNGVLNDASNSMLRYVKNSVTDFFVQAVIDFLLGILSSRDFELFDRDMVSRDPSRKQYEEQMRMQGLEAFVNSIFSQYQDENIISALSVLYLPKEDPNVPKERFLVLTSAAVYINREESPMRFALSSITHVQYGLAVTSAVHTCDYDPERNMGVRLCFDNTEPQEEASFRVEESLLSHSNPATSAECAFQLAQQIVDARQRACPGDPALSIDTGDISSLEEARAVQPVHRPLIAYLKRIVFS